jgi:hypothetical protein
MPNGTDDATNAPDLTELHELQSATVWDSEGYKLGKVSQVFQDPAGRPQWVGVALGLFNSSEKFIPLAGARRGEGDYAADLHVAHPKDTIENAPDVADPALLTPEEEEALNRHYAG